MKRVAIIAVALLLVGFGCKSNETPTAGPTAQQPKPVEQKRQPDPNKPISYSLGDIRAGTGTSIALVRDVFKADALATQASACGQQLDQAHFTEVLGKFTNQRGLIYSFTFIGETQAANEYSLLAVANGPGYKNMDEFKTDFERCGVGGKIYPLALNENWLVFETVCDPETEDGMAVDDGFGKPLGCNLLREQVRKTVQVL